MIELTQLKRSEGVGLTLQNGEWIVEETLAEPLSVNSSIKLRIKKGVQAFILDRSCDANIEITVEEEAKLDYQILHSKNTKRHLDCFGSLAITEIVLDETEEELQVNLLKENTVATLDLLSIVSAKQAIFHQRMNHLCRMTHSNISNFGVAMKEGSILFDTVGKIEKGQSLSKCVQLSKGIVMDDASVITSRPILLIDEYDVVANHGASIGKMSDEILFYLMSRGLSRTDAFLLILEGIINPFVQKIKDSSLQDEIRNQLAVLIKR